MTDSRNVTGNGAGILKIVLHFLYYAIILVFLILLGTVLYLSNTWKELSYSEIVFHLMTSVEGTNPEMIKSALLGYALPVLIAFILIIILLRKIGKKNKRIAGMVSVAILMVVIAINGIVLYRFDSNTHVIRDFVNSIRGTKGADFVEENYIDPKRVSITFPETKRNLIYIYLESMEATYSDVANGGAYDDNYIPNLTALSEANDNFGGDSNTLNGGIVLPGTNWTTGALFAQTSGIPLFLPIGEDQVGGSEEFFPSITTLGDILNSQGYVNVLEMGSTANFGGVKSYYTKHGNYVIHDYDYAKESGIIPEDYYVFWGYEDEKLFDFAKKDLTELAQKGQPFNYTMFTIDTHFEDGYVCRLCDNKYGDNQYANVISCSDRQVTEFVKWIQQQDFYENTTIVITGDHTTMDADFCKDVDEDYQRKTYTSFVNSAVEPQIKEHREYSTIDLFPTILASLGVDLSSDQLGIGTNLYGTKETMIERYGKDTCMDELAKGSAFVENLAKVIVDDNGSIEHVKDAAYIETADEDGKVRFRLHRIDAISRLDVRGLRLSVHNSKTGETIDYEMEINRTRTGWYGIVHSDIPFDMLSELDCKVYISAFDYEDYLLKEFTSSDFAEWDVDWDID